MPRGKKKEHDDDEEEKPKHRQAKPKKREHSNDDDEDEKPKKKREAKPKEVIEVSSELQDFWSAQQPSLLFRSKARDDYGSTYTFAPGEKIAAFDFDDTLVCVKSRSRFPVDANDFKPFNKKTYSVIKKFHADGFKIVVFSNQKGVGKQLEGKASRTTRQRAENFIADLGISDVTVLMATQDDDFRKPNTGMWTFFVESLNDGVAPDLAESFYAGDAAGRKFDFADSDKVFAENIGLPFKTPEELFGEGPKKDITAGGPVAGGPNEAMAQCFKDLATNLEENGHEWPARAAKRAADTIAAYADPILTGKQLAPVKGIGKGTIAKIDEFLKTGTIAGASGGGGGGGGGGEEANSTAKADAAMAAHFL